MNFISLEESEFIQFLETTHPQWLLVLLPEAEKSKIPLLQDHCQKRGVALVGAVFPALIVGGDFKTQGGWCLSSKEKLPSFLIPNMTRPAREAAWAIGTQVASVLDGYTYTPTLYMIFDGLVPNISSILDALYLQLADRVSYAGVNAGSETFQPMPCVFDTYTSMGEGVLCLLLPGGGTVLRHGYPAPERVMNATATEGNRILQLDWQPAFEMYQAIIQAEYGVHLTQENFYEYAVHFPFGILQASREVLVRIPVARADDGSLFCIGEVPENSLLVLLKAPQGSPCMHELVGALSEANGSLAQQQLLTFYCAGRRMHLGEGALQELQQLQDLTGVRQMAGALSLGEIGSTYEGGYPMFHNATLVCTPWGHR